ncbi:Lps-induced tn factor-like [Entamoeba marina]
MSTSEHQPILSIEQSSPEMFCAICNRSVQPVTSTQCGTFSYVLALVIFLFGGVCFFWIPFVLNSCKDTKYTCPLCSSTLALRTRL